MSLTSYRAAPPRVSGCDLFVLDSLRSAPPCSTFGLKSLHWRDFLTASVKQITPRLEDAALDVWGVYIGNMLLYLEGPAVTYSPVP